MLVISRHVGESIKIGDDITLIVNKATDEDALVHLGIAAPREVEIYREEIYLKIQKEKDSEKCDTVKKKNSVTVYNRGRKRLGDVLKAAARPFETD